MCYCTVSDSPGNESTVPCHCSNQQRILFPGPWVWKNQLKDVTKLSCLTPVSPAEVPIAQINTLSNCTQPTVLTHYHHDITVLQSDILRLTQERASWFSLIDQSSVFHYSSRFVLIIKPTTYTFQWVWECKQWKILCDCICNLSYIYLLLIYYNGEKENPLCVSCNLIVTSRYLIRYSSWTGLDCGEGVTLYLQPLPSSFENSQLPDRPSWDHQLSAGGGSSLILAFSCTRDWTGSHTEAPPLISAEVLSPFAKAVWNKPYWAFIMI